MKTIYDYPPLQPCFWCRRLMMAEEMNRDHVIPRALGGLDGPIVDSCRACNQERGVLTDAFVRWRTLRQELVTEPCPRRLRRLLKRLLRRGLLERQAHWRAIEMERLGYSPTGELDFSPPVLPWGGAGG